MVLNFQKYQGTGNDFILVDNLSGMWDALDIITIQKLCDRNFGIGADGLIKINASLGSDFEMDYYNADGTKSFCGNGARCAVTFVHQNLILKKKFVFSAIDGLHEAEITENRVALKMNDTSFEINPNEPYILNTGSPHFVKYVSDLEQLDVFNEGRKIRYGSPFKKEGINVNFVKRISEHSISIRTYERGVENETLSCGTGATACALVNAVESQLFGRQKMSIQVIGGSLWVAFNRINPTTFVDIQLVGPAMKVFEGKIEV
jgi:diaminopimelate epimerase